MAQEYELITGSLYAADLGKPVLSEAPADEVLAALQFGMTYQGGKHRGRQANKVAIKTIAQMAYDHLKLSDYVISQPAPSDAMALTRYMASKIPMKD